VKHFQRDNFLTILSKFYPVSVHILGQRAGQSGFFRRLGDIPGAP
jgi:hypothetical protein